MTNVRADLWNDLEREQPAGVEQMSLHRVEVSRVASPRRHGELIRAAEQTVRRAERSRVWWEIGFYVAAVLLTVAWVALIAAFVLTVTA